MQRFAKLCLIIALAGLAGCTPFWRTWMKSDKPTPATYSVLPKHESWCYKTLGKVDCYPGPQRLSPESLVSVDPPSRFPMTREAHAKALADYQPESK